MPDEPGKGAILSADGVYRYALTRGWWDPERPGFPRRVNFVMLNPSTADHEVDDPTIRRCVGFAKAWGYDGLVVTNLYPLRATDPRHLFAAEHRRGADDGATNLGYVRGIAASCVSVVCAWGARGEPAVVAETLRTIRAGRDPELMEPIAVLRINKAGSPAHPLYLPASCRPIPWND